jgi:hypothetical protein
MAFRTSGVLVSVHRPQFRIVENTTFQQLDLLPSSGEEKTPFSIGSLKLKLALSMGPLQLGMRPDPFSEKLLSNKVSDDGELNNPAILRDVCFICISFHYIISIWAVQSRIAR